MRNPDPDSPSASRSALFATLAVVLAQVSINLGAALGKTIFPLVGPAGLAFLRTGISALLLLVMVRPWRARPSVANWAWLGLYGLALGGMTLFIYLAFQRIPIGIAVSLEILGPLAVVLASSRSLRDFGWFCVAITGVFLLTGRTAAGGPVDPVGVAMALAAAVCWGSYILVGKRAAQAGEMVAVAIGMGLATVLSLPFAIVQAGEQLLAPTALAYGVGVALLSSTLPYILEMRAFRHLSSRRFGIVTSAAPAIATVVGWAVLGERLTGVQVAAIVMIVVASAGAAGKAR